MIEDLQEVITENQEWLEEIVVDYVNRAAEMQNPDDDDVIEFINIIYNLNGLGKPEVVFLLSPGQCKDKSEEAYAKKSCISMRDAVNMLWYMLWEKMVNEYWGGEGIERRFEMDRDAKLKKGILISQMLSGIDMTPPEGMDESRAPDIARFFEPLRRRLRNNGHQGKTLPSDFVELGMVYDFFKTIDVVKPAPDFDVLLKSGIIYYFLPFGNRCYVSKPPVSVRLNEDDTRLHSHSGKAVEFEDGFGYHFVNGIDFDEELFTKAFIDSSLTGEDIIRLQNAEQKVEIIKHYGYDHLIAATNAKLLDTFEGKSWVTGDPVKYELYEFQMRLGAGQDGTFRFVKVEDHTTHKIVTLGVPATPECDTCMKAIAWTFDMKEDEYNPFMES